MRDTIGLINQVGKTGQAPGYGNKHRHLGTFVEKVTKKIIPVTLLIIAGDLLARASIGMFSKDNRDNDRRNDRNPGRRY